MFRPGNIGHLGRLGLVAASQPSLVSQALAILAKYGAAANLYLPGVGAINGITAGNWLDSAGTTAATVDGQVGLVVSAGKAVGSNVATGPWINTHTTAFDTFSSVGFSGFTATTTGAKTDVRAGVPCTFQSGKSYQIEFTVTMTGATAGSVWFASALSGAQVINNQSGISSGVSYRVVGTATADRTHLMIIFNTSGAATVTLSGLQVRELPGAHLTQSTADNRPVLRRGLVNLLTYSHDLTNAAWQNLGVFVKTLEPSAGPNGTAATRITATSTPAAPVRSAIVATATAHTYAYIYKPGTYRPDAAWLLIRNDTTSTLLPVSITTVALGGGWVLACCSASSGINVGNSLCIYLGATSSIPEGLNYQIASVGFFGGLLTAQQIIDAGGIPTTTTAPASSTNGPFAWQFDGSNDTFSVPGLATGNEGWMCAGVRFGAPISSFETVFANGAGSPTMAGVWLGRLGGVNEVRMGVGNGAALSMSRMALPAIGTDCVISGGWSASTVFVGLGNTETTPISRPAGVPVGQFSPIVAGYTTTVHFLTGNLYPLIIMPTVLPTASERATLRQFVASLSGVTL